MTPSVGVDRMVLTAKLLRTLGLVLALGSVLAFVVIDVTVGAETDAVLIAHQRLFASAISRALTVPGVALLVTAAGIEAVRCRFRFVAHWRAAAMLVLCILIVVNTLLFVTPLVDHVTQLAKLGAAQGHLIDTYAALKSTEDRYGMVNFVMLAGVFVLSLWEPGPTAAA